MKMQNENSRGLRMEPGNMDIKWTKEEVEKIYYEGGRS